MAMAINLDRFKAAAGRAVAVWRGRTIEPIFTMTINDLEAELATFAPGWFPIKRPDKRTQEFDIIRPLLVWGPWPLRFQNAPIVRAYGNSVDEFIGALRELFHMPDASSHEVVYRLSQMLQLIRKFRGRGYRYGLMSGGVAPAIVDTVADTPLTEKLAQGRSQDCAPVLLRAAEAELAAATCDYSEEELDFLRIVHAKWRESPPDQLPDEQFRGLLTGPTGRNKLEALDILTGHPYGPIGWFKPFGAPEVPTWEELAAIALGVSGQLPASCS